MISLQYELTTYKKFMEDLAEFLGAEFANNTVQFPEATGSGYMKLVELPDGVEALISHFRLKHDMLLERKKDNSEYYTFCCEEIKDVTGFSITIESDTYALEQNGQSALYLTSFLYDVGYSLKKNTLVNSIRVLLKPEWMKKYLGFDKGQGVLQQYLELKTAGVLYKKIDAEARQLFSELLKNDKSNSTLYYYSRLLRLIEKFSASLDEQMLRQPKTMEFSSDDIERIRKIETRLISDFSVPPPTIPELAKSVALSESKLKSLFKAVYGLPPFEYFQKHRMEKARVMLLSNKYSIKDVGYALGYVNLSNFTLAFKKQFGQLPSELLK
ncbi:MAG: helix-turn-helix transcriptional regulator [Chitinophagaceae bacterium]|nr:helix-turn-helix transcriptional regulator [Chitinophagaceae bacterium]